MRGEGGGGSKPSLRQAQAACADGGHGPWGHADAGRLGAARCARPACLRRRPHPHHRALPDLQGTAAAPGRRAEHGLLPGRQVRGAAQRWPDDRRLRPDGPLRARLQPPGHQGRGRDRRREARGVPHRSALEPRDRRLLGRPARPAPRHRPRPGTQLAGVRHRGPGALLVRGRRHRLRR